ncbi:hypothetical protein KHS38_21075 [Mucilaginibacter sp. Bleaf8]|uniref:hypothetical protein n=1 Tax=Mucilaginibacter sp. Bleaf8 TaxID=2834430 RepID=UPI001BCFD52C|nr:hypothetical protein [Mucilaginibacter sp. Bleaf8]MBS7566911.1 hypothetical protein [Mucilaginibacter sp. Bleaf8]
MRRAAIYVMRTIFVLLTLTIIIQAVGWMIIAPHSTPTDDQVTFTLLIIAVFATMTAISFALKVAEQKDGEDIK